MLILQIFICDLYFACVVVFCQFGALKINISIILSLPCNFYLKTTSKQLQRDDTGSHQNSQTLFIDIINDSDLINIQQLVNSKFIATFHILHHGYQ